MIANRIVTISIILAFIILVYPVFGSQVSCFRSGEQNLKNVFSMAEGKTTTPSNVLNGVSDSEIDAVINSLDSKGMLPPDMIVENALSGKLNKLGEGHFGTVYSTEDGRVVKIISKNPEIFGTEANNLQALAKDGLAPDVSAFGRATVPDAPAERGAYIISDRIYGTDVGQITPQNEPLLIDFEKKAAEKGWLIEDYSSRNIMIGSKTPDGDVQAWVVDAGKARRACDSISTCQPCGVPVSSMCKKEILTFYQVKRKSEFWVTPTSHSSG